MSSITSVTIPNSGTSIEQYAFTNCSSLTSINIPEGVKSISNGAFYGCSSLTSITIPNSVTIINDFAFCDCKNLSTLVLGSKVKEIGSTGNGMSFYNCDKLKTIYYNGTIEDWINIKISSTNSGTRPNQNSNFKKFYILDENGSIEYNGNKYSELTDVVIPEGVTTISSYTFYNMSSITSIVISNSVTSIAYGAFANGYSFKKVYYTGTKTDWDNISLDDNWTQFDTNIYYYSDAQPINATYKYWHYVDGIITEW